MAYFDSARAETDGVTNVPMASAANLRHSTTTAPSASAELAGRRTLVRPLHQPLDDGLLDRRRRSTPPHIWLEPSHSEACDAQSICARTFRVEASAS